MSSLLRPKWKKFAPQSRVSAKNFQKFFFAFFFKKRSSKRRKKIGKKIFKISADTLSQSIQFSLIWKRFDPVRNTLFNARSDSLKPFLEICSIKWTRWESLLKALEFTVSYFEFLLNTNFWPKYKMKNFSQQKVLVCMNLLDSCVDRVKEEVLGSILLWGDFFSLKAKILPPK